jgi:hypothetical protein
LCNKEFDPLGLEQGISNLEREAGTLKEDINKLLLADLFGICSKKKQAFIPKNCLWQF